jgi:hypothetical protein
MYLPLWARRFILNTKRGKRMKAVVQMGYKSYVMDTEKALTMLEMLTEAEVYESKWEDKTKTVAHYVYQQDCNDFVRDVKILPKALYNLAKLAGKPNKE